MVPERFCVGPSMAVDWGDDAPAISRASVRDNLLYARPEASVAELEAAIRLNTVSEPYIQAALRPLFAGRTALVIAHRLSTVLATDLILVFDRGRLVEQGTHAELARRGGLYADLYEGQFLLDRHEAALQTSGR
jgi:ABC-type multidrug transport system fused ATPase/permease subunit